VPLQSLQRIRRQGQLELDLVRHPDPSDSTL
jgi:hypothetical protein